MQSRRRVVERWQGGQRQRGEAAEARPVRGEGLDPGQGSQMVGGGRVVVEGGILRLVQMVGLGRQEICERK